MSQAAKSTEQIGKGTEDAAKKSDSAFADPQEVCYGES